MVVLLNMATVFDGECQDSLVVGESQQDASMSTISSGRRTRGCLGLSGLATVTGLLGVSMRQYHSVV